MHAFEFLIVFLMVAFLGLSDELRIAREPQLWFLEGSSASALVNPNEVESINTKKDQHLGHQPKVRKPRILNQDVTALLKKQQTISCLGVGGLNFGPEASHMSWLSGAP